MFDFVHYYSKLLIYMMVLCTQVNKMYVIATLSVGYTLRVAITYILQQVVVLF